MLVGGGHFVPRPPGALSGEGGEGGEGGADAGAAAPPAAPAMPAGLEALLGGGDNAPPGYYKGARSGLIMPLPSSMKPADVARLVTDRRSAARKQRMFMGELLHIFRPMLYSFLRMRSGGAPTWMPLLLALAMDLVSGRVSASAISADMDGTAHLNANKEACTAKESAELSRRKFGVLYYLLWNPLFDKLTRVIIEKVRRSGGGGGAIFECWVCTVGVWGHVPTGNSERRSEKERRERERARARGGMTSFNGQDSII